MAVVISGTSGISGTNGSAGTPAVQGEDTNTGIFFPAADTVAVATGGTERMRVDSSGNAGLGVTPSAWGGGFTGFQLRNSLSLWGASGTSAYYSNNAFYDGSSRKYIFTGAAAEYEQGAGTHAWKIAPSGTAGNAITFTQAMTLDASGRLMVGTTSQDGSLTVANGSIEGPVASVTNSRNVSGDQVLVLKNGANANNTSSYYLVCQQPGVANRMFIFGNGNVVNLNNSYGALSDEKLKENIIDSGSQWDDLKAVRVRKYSLKADNADGPNQIGVIAQELEAAGMGGLVFESPDLDPDKQPTGEVTKQVNYSILYMKAVKALQEAMARIETLEAKVNALEAQ